MNHKQKLQPLVFSVLLIQGHISWLRPKHLCKKYWFSEKIQKHFINAAGRIWKSLDFIFCWKNLMNKCDVVPDCTYSALFTLAHNHHYMKKENRFPQRFSISSLNSSLSCVQTLCSCKQKKNQLCSVIINFEPPFSAAEHTRVEYLIDLPNPERKKAGCTIFPSETLG